jgi:hypothetical protein
LFVNKTAEVKKLKLLYVDTQVLMKEYTEAKDLEENIKHNPVRRKTTRGLKLIVSSKMHQIFKHKHCMLMVKSGAKAWCWNCKREQELLTHNKLWHNNFSK